MKVLIICYCYPPDPGPRAYRWSAIAELWAEIGHEVHVISGWKLGALEEELLGGVHVHRVGGAFSENLRLWIERRRGGGAGKIDARKREESLGGERFSGWARIAKIIHDATWKKVYWPDSTCLWFFAAKKMALRLIEGITFDAVISTSTPYTGHLVGRAVKAARGDIHWMVDIGDPFWFGKPALNNSALHQARNRRSEQKILELCDSATVTVASCQRIYEQAFSGITGKIKVVPPLYSGDGVMPARTSSAKKRLVFTGSLYRDIRNPDYLLRLLSAVLERNPQVEAHFYGRVNDCADCFAPYESLKGKNLFVHGQVARDVALKATFEADVLINIGNDTNFQIPSKLVDYAASGLPIVNIISVADDSSVDFLNNYPAAITFQETGPTPGDVELLTSFIVAPPPITPQMIDTFMTPYRLPAIEQQYRALLGEL